MWGVGVCDGEVEGLGELLCDLGEGLFECGVFWLVFVGDVVEGVCDVVGDLVVGLLLLLVHFGSFCVWGVEFSLWVWYCLVCVVGLWVCC